MRIIKPVSVGGLKLDGRKIFIQSMLNVRSGDIENNVRQAEELEAAGCDILRVAVPDFDSVRLIPAIKEKIKIPLVADIHFNYKLALKAIDAGIDKIRINPGNIGAPDGVKVLADACRKAGIPIRIGVNSGSLEKKILEKYGCPSAEALAESAALNIDMLRTFDFDDIVISIKSSNVKEMIKAYRYAAERFDYPLHLGVTEAGTERMGLIKSSIGIGSLLADGIGETIRVSLTANPLAEIGAAKDILKALGLRRGVEIISCPTCGRTSIDIESIAKKVEEALKTSDKEIKVAIMGCAVNGPGEAAEADIGIAGGNGCAVIFKKGKILRKIPEPDIINELLTEIGNA